MTTGRYEEYEFDPSNGYVNTGYVNTDGYHTINSDDNIYIKDLYKWAKKIREKQGLSVKKLAERAGVSESTIYRFEKGSLKVKITSVIMIVCALGYTMDIDIRSKDGSSIFISKNNTEVKGEV